MKKLILFLFVSALLLPAQTSAADREYIDSVKVDGRVVAVKIKVENIDTLDHTYFVSRYIEEIRSDSQYEIDWFVFGFDATVHLIRRQGEGWIYYGTPWQNTRDYGKLDINLWSELIEKLALKYTKKGEIFFMETPMAKEFKDQTQELGRVKYGSHKGAIYRKK